MKYKPILITLFLAFFSLSYSYPVYANDYVLPYPSFMPGNRLYSVHQIWERVMAVWNFGDIASTKYHIALSDRYLVETKTLLEYDQYLLAEKALEKSNDHFLQALLYLIDVEKSKKDGGKQLGIIENAAEKHIEVLGVLEEKFPDDIHWEAEKKDPVTIPIPFLIKQSKIIRSYAFSLYNE